MFVLVLMPNNIVHICPGRRAINLSTIFRAILGAGGYGLRCIYVHIVYTSIVRFILRASGATRGKSVQRLCGDYICGEIVQYVSADCCRAVRAASARKSYGARAGIVQCHLRYLYGLRAYDFSNL